jgi:L-arabinose isomerase
MKVIAADLEGGTSFMEDYTYHLSPKGHQVLGSHMLEVCESIAAGKPKLEVHPLSIGGKEDPVRLVFDTPPGNAINASVVDLGNRFRMIVNEVKVVSLRSRCQSSRSLARSGSACPISRRPARHGSTQGARTTPVSATR